MHWLMNRLRLDGLQGFVALGVLFASSASAGQCTDWAPGFGRRGSDGSATAIFIDESGPGPRLIVGGTFTEIGGAPIDGIAAYDGTSWAQIGPPLAGSPTAFAMYDLGGGPELYVAIPAGTGPALWRLNNGQWVDLGVSASSVRAMEVYDDGTGPALYVGGFNINAPGVPSGALLRYDGAWTNVEGAAPQPGVRVSSLSVHDDGFGDALYIGGRFLAFGPLHNEDLVRLSGSTLEPVTNPGPSPSAGNASNGIRAMVSARRGAASVLHICLNLPAQGGGADDYWFFSGPTSWVSAGYADGIDKFAIQRRPGGADVVWGVGEHALYAFTGTVQGRIGKPWYSGLFNSVAVFPSASGDEIWVAAQGATNAIGQAVQRWDGAVLTPAGPGPVFSDIVHSMCVHDFGEGDELVLLPFDSQWRFSHFNGDEVRRAAFPEVGGSGFPEFYSAASHDGDLYAGTSAWFGEGPAVARFDGSAWTFLGSGLAGTSGEYVLDMISADLGSGPELFIAGPFELSAPVASGIARLDGNVFRPLGPGLTGTSFWGGPRTLEVWNDGTGNALYIGGSFGSTGFASQTTVARWDGQAFATIPNAPPASAAVTDLVAGIFGGERLLMAVGTFDELGDGTPAPGAASFDGNQWRPLVGAPSNLVHLLDAEGSVACAHDPDGHGERLYLYGLFEEFGFIERRLGSWDGVRWRLEARGSETSALGPDVRTMASVDLGDGRALYVGGEFTHLDGVPSTNLARLDGCGWRVGTPYCTSFPSSQGQPARCRASGSTSVSTNDLVLHLEDAAANAFALFALGTDRASTPLGAGTLCIGGQIVRVLPPGGTDTTGSFSRRLNLTGPFGAGLISGSTQFMQAFYRDTGSSGAVLGMSDALSISFTP